MFKEKVSKISFVNIQDFKFCELLNLSIDVKFKIKKVLVAQLVKRLPTMWETQVQSLVWEDSPGEGHGNPLQYVAWKIPQTKEPGRLLSIGLHFSLSY